jgi:hypothetical protein
MEITNFANRFRAQLTRPRKLEFVLEHEGVVKSRHGELDWLGWTLHIWETSGEGEEKLVSDDFEMSLAEIMLCADYFATGPLEWTDEEHGLSVDLVQLQPEFDRSRRFSTALFVATNEEETKRACVNLYDDRVYRITTEEKILAGGREAWLPQEWSAAFGSLDEAKATAQRAFG